MKNGKRELAVSQAEMLAEVFRMNVEDLLDFADEAVVFADSKNRLKNSGAICGKAFYKAFYEKVQAAMDKDSG